jgi:hypothetical protein
MTRTRAFVLAALAFLVLPFASAKADVYVGFGYRGPYYRHHHYNYYYPRRVYVAPQTVYVAPRPVYVVPAPVVVQPAPTVIQAVPAPAAYPVPVPQAP